MKNSYGIMEFFSITDTQTHGKQAASIGQGQQEPRGNCRNPNPPVQISKGSSAFWGISHTFNSICSQFTDRQIDKQMKMTNKLN